MPQKAASPGDEFVYDHPDDQGYGHSALGQPLSAEMTELDMHDGTQVTLLEYDEDSGWPLVEWTDGVGLPRITTIDPDFFDLYFKSV
jgi:hypothetical protein